MRTPLALLFAAPFAIVAFVGCALDSPDGQPLDRQDQDLTQDVLSNGGTLGGRNGLRLDVQWLQWRDGSCKRPTNLDGSPRSQGKPEGAACARVSDCEASCNACPSSDARYLVAACLDHKCTSAAVAGTLAFEQQSRFSGRELCR